MPKILILPVRLDEPKESTNFLNYNTIFDELRYPIPFICAFVPDQTQQSLVNMLPNGETVQLYPEYNYSFNHILSKNIRLKDVDASSFPYIAILVNN